MNHEIKFELEEVYDPQEGEEEKRYPAKVEITTQGIEIWFPGYGTSCMEEGAPIFIEVREGVPHIVIWSDINQEDPTHTISLEKAKEELHKEKT
jgi:hypothetical protein